MTRFLARRLLNYIVLLALASFLTFCTRLLDVQSTGEPSATDPRPPQSAIEAKAAELDLDKPIPLRYAHWVSGAIRGDFGTTIGGQPVSDELWRRIGVSLRLVVIGSVLGHLIGVVVGAWGAVRQYRLSDRVITILSLLVISTPTFVMANLFILAALRVNNVLGVQLFEYTGETSPDAVGGGWNQFVDRLQHLVLPTLTLALVAIAGLQPIPTQRDARRARPGLHPYGTGQGPDPTAGAVQARFAHRADPDGHLVRLRRRGLVTGAVFVEKIFGWHGMGEWVVTGIATQDTNIVAAITLFAGADRPVGRVAVRRHLRGARSEGAGHMTEPVTASRNDRAVRCRRRRLHIATNPGAAPIPAQQARGGRADPAGAAVHRLLRAAATAAVQLHRPGLLRPAAAAGVEPLVRHQRARSGPAGPDPARHAEVAC